MSMYDLQMSLPSLPLSLLESSCKKLLEWSYPLLSEVEYSSSEKSIDFFQSPKGLGPVLQNHLDEWNQREDISNWLEPFWYDTYLKNRAPLPINSNVAFVLEKNKEVENLSQSGFAASLISALFQYQQILSNETLAIDYQDSTPLCMNQYKTILGTSRIPSQEIDELQTDSQASHIIIMINGHVYVLRALNDEGQVMEHDLIVENIRWMIENSKEENSLAVGNLTTLDRGQWAELRTYLNEIDSVTLQSISLIETALAVIVMDQNEYADDSEMFKSMLCGDSNNRWYDKSLQFIVNAHHIAVNYEHSGVDGTTLGNLVRFLYQNMKAGENKEIKQSVCQSDELIFTLDDVIKLKISEAKLSSDQTYDDLAVEVLSFTDFGKERIKSLQISPDSFIQMGIQLAQYKTFGKIYNTYEAVMTKRFYKGRTEAMRPVTRESTQFVENRTKDNLITASKKHIEQIIECKNGQGFERHLFGLKKMHEKFYPSQQLPEIFTSPSYQRITENVISTSTSNSSGLIYEGYGPSVNDGYAVRYLIYKDRIHYVFSCKVHNESNLRKLKAAMYEAMNELSSILDV
ncbi:MAG: choline/carnitine O-acyltransferase [Clostridiales bacterium]|nr:choline/carnitine O-acyltransferase [Clostridiales bacterium]